jgi:hypothetical protein
MILKGLGWLLEKSIGEILREGIDAKYLIPDEKFDVKNVKDIEVVDVSQLKQLEPKLVEKPKITIKIYKDEYPDNIGRFFIVGQTYHIRNRLRQIGYKHNLKLSWTPNIRGYHVQSTIYEKVIDPVTGEHITDQLSNIPLEQLKAFIRDVERIADVKTVLMWWEDTTLKDEPVEMR